MEVVQNLVNGKPVDARDGATIPLVDPCTGATYGSAPRSSGGRRRRRGRRRQRRVRRLAVGHTVGAQPRAVAHRRRAREGRRPVHRRRVPQHRQAEGVDGVRRDPARRRPDPLLRGRGADARGPRRGRVHGGAHVVHPARADRRRRAGVAVELPVDDGDLEDRARARGRQHGRAEAGGDRRRRPPSCSPSSRPSSCPPVCSTSCAAIATAAARSSSTRCPGWCRSPAACARAWRSRRRPRPT